MSEAEKKYTLAVRKLIEETFYDRRTYVAYNEAMQTLREELRKDGKSPSQIIARLRELAQPPVPTCLPAAKVYSH